jgi:outer membrane protein insertion porin family
VLSFLLLASLLFAQTPTHPRARSSSSTETKLVSIRVTGSQRYTPEEVIVATGLQNGSPGTDDDFKLVAKRLSESGAFAEVTYGFSRSPAGTKLDLQLQDSAQFVSARFDNFVWWSDDELRQSLQKRLPLFKGELPASGNLPDDLGDALQAILVEHNLPGHVDYLRQAKDGGPLEAIAYTVSGVNVTIRKLEFPGASDADLPRLEAAGKQLLGADYLQSRMRTVAAMDLRPVYLQQGYLQAEFGDPAPAITSSKDADFEITVRQPVAPGPQFHVGDIQLTGTQGFSADQLAKALHLQPGQLADVVQLQKDLDEIRKLYGTRGYMKAASTFEPQLDVPSRTANFTIRIQEGDIYRMGDLTLEGLDQPTTATFQTRWNLRKGEVFDASYLERFAQESIQFLPARLRWNIGSNVELDESDKTVDVTLRFIAQGN